MAAFFDFVTGTVHYSDLPGQGRNARRRFAPLWKIWPLMDVVDEVHHVVFVDGIYLSHKLVVLIACTKSHVLGWHVARSENAAAWQALFDRIAAPDVVVCDGGSGIAKAVRGSWSGTRIQRCTFHAFSAVKRHTTTRPRTQAGVDLYGLAKDLLKVDSREKSLTWLSDLTAWNAQYKDFLAEKTKLANGQYVDTHQRLIKAKNSLNTLARQGTLFTFLEPDLIVDDDPIPAMSNLIEGKINSQLRAMLRQHRGMCLDHQIKAVCWWCYLHTENPKSPARLLENAVTDEHIQALFARAAHRGKAQQEINQWGTGVNWTDFHHAVPWKETY